MIAEFFDSAAGIPVYINPAHVVAMRPDLEDPHRVTLIKLQDGESIRVLGEHSEVAERLAHVA